ncbi:MULTISPECIES: ABC transporter permease [Jonquetella]|uniref:ABC-type transport system, involved in lipoprotein release, permease component n=1 Tax=Jonquetella anthropi DSM 22815 TaxID=885272 RepID=H0UKU6_9BACT|nr:MULTISPECIES: ABC transporter permease [Jonquetella]EHM13305.1 ABC-type transport system, involved in lipoprotein release, permease component [Jonquetella anthropi DSM 22815]ERL23607.1 MacB-like periplasmic core domain protein [Jonquetella sp. BV3C21]
MANRRQKMYLKMVTSSLIRRASRLIIAVLAIAIGATILSGLVTIYYDIPRQLGREFRSYGANLLILPKGDTKISRDDLVQLRSLIGSDRIVGMAPYRYQTVKINEHPYIIAGTDLPEAKKNSPFWYVEGSWGNADEPDKVMVGKEIAKTLNLSLGDTFTVLGVKYGKHAEASGQNLSAVENQERDEGDQNFSKKLSVCGIVTTGGAEEGFIFADVNMLDSLIGDSFHGDVVECSVVADGEQMEKLTGTLQAKMSDIQPRSVRRLTQSQDIVLGKLQALVLLVTVVVLIITMISVYTTMMAMVAERRREIALKKALGAENRLVMGELLGEGAFLGLIGSAFGVFLGFEFAQRVSLNVFGRAINFPWPIIPITIAVFIAITVLASILPVRRVMDIHPAIVLRGE